MVGKGWMGGGAGGCSALRDPGPKRQVCHVGSLGSSAPNKEGRTLGSHMTTSQNGSHVSIPKRKVM